MTKSYIIYNKMTGVISRVGSCPDLSFQALVENALSEEMVIEGTANDLTQKIDVNTKEVVDKTPEEIEADKPIEIPFADKAANITNAQLQAIIDRLDALEAK